MYGTDTVGISVSNNGGWVGHTCTEACHVAPGWHGSWGRPRGPTATALGMPTGGHVLTCSVTCLECAQRVLCLVSAAEAWGRRVCVCGEWVRRRRHHATRPHRHPRRPTWPPPAQHAPVASGSVCTWGEREEFGQAHAEMACLVWWEWTSPTGPWLSTLLRRGEWRPLTSARVLPDRV